jgi:hypothetical protein
VAVTAVFAQRRGGLPEGADPALRHGQADGAHGDGGRDARDGRGAPCLLAM